MLTYKATSAESRPAGYDKPLLLLLLCFIWIVTGLWGHAPWKTDELVHIAPIAEFARNGGWLPLLGGDPMLQVPPLYYWCAAALGRLLSPWLLPFHDAARLTSGIFVALALLGLGQAARLVYGARQGRLAVIGLLGCIGMVVWGHSLTPQTAALAGFAWSLWGCAAAREQRPYATAVLATGMIVSFWSAPLLEAVLVMFLPFLLTISPLWRQPHYLRTLLLALPIALLACAAWPVLLATRSTALLLQWLTVDGTMHVKLAPLAADGLTFYLRRLSWLGLPVLPLAAWSLWHRRGRWEAGDHLGLFAFGTWFVVLTLLEFKQDAMAVPLLLALALLAAGGIDTLRRGAASAMNWFGMLAFGVFGLFVWVAWSGATLGVPARLGERAIALAPDFEPTLRPWAVVTGLLFSLFWLWAITRKRPLARQAITNWTLGITLLWALVVVLTLPWFDANRSYERTTRQLLAQLPAGTTCVATWNASKALQGALDYYGNIDTYPGQTQRCPLLLTRNEEVPGMPLVWQGSPGWSRGKEVLRLYRTAP